MFKKYLLDRLDSITAWIGLIGLALLAVGFDSGLAVLFLALIAMPETHFRDLFSGWTKKIREFEE